MNQSLLTLTLLATLTLTAAAQTPVNIVRATKYEHYWSAGGTNRVTTIWQKPSEYLTNHFTSTHTCDYNGINPIRLRHSIVTTRASVHLGLYSGTTVASYLFDDGRTTTATNWVHPSDAKAFIEDMPDWFGLKIYSSTASEKVTVYCEFNYFRLTLSDPPRTYKVFGHPNDAPPGYVWKGDEFTMNPGPPTIRAYPPVWKPETTVSRYVTDLHYTAK